MIRVAVPTDHEAIVPLFLLQWSEPWDQEKIQERRQRWSGSARCELVYERGGRLLGWAEATEFKPGRVVTRIAVTPEARRQGIGSELCEALALTAKPARVWKAHVSDHDEPALRFAEKHGFLVVAHDFESVIDLQEYDVSQFQPYVERLLASDLRVATVAELGDTEEIRHEVWDIERVTDADIPNLNPADLMTWEEAQRVTFTAAHYRPAGEFAALDGDRFVALAGVSELAPGRYYNEHTCVLPAYRGRGLAIALKAMALDYAKREGGVTCRTRNNSENRAMLAINERFGYQRQPGYYEVQRTVA